MDTHSYKGWLNSDSFLKRAFAILGYNTVASFIIAIPFYIIFFAIMFAVFGGSGVFDGAKDMDNIIKTMEACDKGDQAACARIKMEGDVLSR